MEPLLSSDGGQAENGDSGRIRRAVRSFDGTEIVYDFYQSNQNRVILVVPGFWRTRQWPSIETLARRIASRGASAAVMDLRGHGESGGTFGFNRDEWRDVEAVARDLVARDGFARVDLLGFSMGGSVAVAAAARVTDIGWGTLLLVSAVADLGLVRPMLNPFTMRRHIALSQAFRRPRFDWGFPFRAKLCAAEEIANVSIPVTIVHVKRDWLVHHRHAVAMFAKAREPKRLAILDIAGRWHADRILTSAPEAIDPLLEEFLSK